MKCLSARLGMALTALLATTVPHAHADYNNWTYTSSSNLPGISAGTSPNAATVSLTGYTGQAGAGSIPVIAYEATTNSSTPVNFSNSPYTVTLAITDTTTKDTGTLTFNGTLSGGLSATNSTLTTQFSASTPTTLSLDGHTYTVSIPQASLILSSNKTQPSFNATVSVNAGTGTPVGGTTGTPEPASLVLASLGFSLLGIGRCWKRRPARRLRGAGEPVG